MPPIARIDFMPIPTQDAERSAGFYRDVLRLEEAARTAGTPQSEARAPSSRSGA